MIDILLRQLPDALSSDLDDIEFEIECIASTSPFRDAEDWLNIGILVGRLEQIKRLCDQLDIVQYVRADELVDRLNQL